MSCMMQNLHRPIDKSLQQPPLTCAHTHTHVTALGSLCSDGRQASSSTRCCLRTHRSFAWCDPTEFCVVDIQRASCRTQAFRSPDVRLEPASPRHCGRRFRLGIRSVALSRLCERRHHFPVRKEDILLAIRSREPIFGSDRIRPEAILQRLRLSRAQVSECCALWPPSQHHETEDAMRW